MATIYNKRSPYFNTSITNGYLDVINYRKILSEDNDIYYELTKKYEYRPDLLAYNLYKNSELWWVFASRNPEVIKDPVFDFVAGIRIYLPKITNINSSLGV
jgi:hypothetical protein